MSDTTNKIIGGVASAGKNLLDHMSGKKKIGRKSSLGSAGNSSHGYAAVDTASPGLDDSNETEENGEVSNFIISDDPADDL